MSIGSSQKLHFCTLFNKAYLLRGYTLLESLNRYEKNAHIYVLAMDLETTQALSRLNLNYVTVIPLGDFETPELLAVKSTRTLGEYCWTCTPHIIKYCIESFKLDHCTYIDADLLFFSSPRVLIEEALEKSVLITEHRYTPAYDQTATAGKYCVQFMYFRNDDQGQQVLNWWADRCTEWCFARVEDGKFGDQKYLDDWTTRFESVHELQHQGGGLAPWNIQQYEVEQLSPLVVRTINGKRSYPAVFYHFHGLKLFAGGTCVLTDYQLSDDAIRAIYRPYFEALAISQTRLKTGNSMYGDFTTVSFRSKISEQIKNLLKPGRKKAKRYKIETLRIGY